MSRRALLAFVALAFVGCSSGRDKLIADLQSARPEVRALAVKALAEKGDPDDVGLFTQAARDPVAIVRAEAMIALGKSKDERVVDLLGEALDDADDQVQLKAAAALASFKSAKARSFLTLQHSRCALASHHHRGLHPTQAAHPSPRLGHPPPAHLRLSPSDAAPSTTST
ncbi:MAG: HEAT repeat domain-containing protein [Myxococcales bacterium]|nr:HEAT repeat domain-containing protein [Myxococcales bacterium]